MVHEKYTYKNGKRFGPYLYENKRVNGKVVTRYLGSKKSGYFNGYGKSGSKKLSIARIISFVFIIIILGMFLSLPFLFKGTFNIYRLLAENFGIGQDAIDERDVFFAPGDPTISFTDFFPSTPPDLSILSLNYFDIGLLTDDSGDNHYSFVDFDRSLVGWWRLNSDNVNQIDDSSYGNVGTVGGVASLPTFDSAGKFGGAYSFTLDSDAGEGGYINLGNPASLNFGANTDKSFSISAWIFPTGWGQIGGAEEYGKIVHKGINTFGDGGYSFYVYPLGFKLHNNGGGSKKCDNSLALNKWQHVSVVYDDNLDLNKITTTFYVNGVKSTCTGNPFTGQSNPGADANTPAYIGNIGAGDAQYVLNRDFQGKIDEVLIFNRSLKAEEISSIYNATKSQYASSFNGLTNGVHKFIGHVVDLEGIKVDTALRSVTINPPTELEVNFIEPTPKDLHVQTINRIPVRLGSSDAVGGHYSFVDFDKSLVGWWRLDNNLINQVDESNYWNYGVVSAAGATPLPPTFDSAGKFGGAYSFSPDVDVSQGGYVNLGNPASLNFGANADKSFSISTWIKLNSFGEGTAGKIVDRSSSGTTGTGGYSFYVRGISGNNNLGFANGGTAYQSITGVISVGPWYHVVAVFNDSTSDSINFYVNGINQGSVAAGLPGSAATSVYIGTNKDFSRDFDGTIDEVLIFNRTLSPDEVEALYDASQADFQYDNEFKGLAEGEHKFIGHAVDLSGARADTELRSVSVDITSPIVGFSTPPTPINGSVIGVNQFSVGLYSEDNSVQGGGGHYSFLDFDNSLVGWWRLNVIGSSQVDDSGYGRTGTCSGATCPTFAAGGGKFGGAFTFDGVDDYIDLGNPSWLRFPTSSFSVSAWIYLPPATTGTYDIVSKRGTGAVGFNRGWGVRMNENTNRLAFELDDGTGNSKAGDEFIGGSISSGAWNHVVVAFDREGGFAKGYINGESAGVGIDISLIGDITGTQNVNIGRAPTNALYFNGKIDEVIIVERNLSASEIKSLYDSRVNKYSNNFAGLIDGKHNFTGYAVDTDGAKDITGNRTVSVDTVNPVVSFGALSIADGGIVNGNDFLVDVDVSDYNFGTVEYKLYDSSFNFLNSFITDYHYGFDLDKYILTADNNKDLTSINSLRIDISGVAYNPVTNTLYLVDNADQVIIEIDRSYNVRREISLTGFGGIDTEGIAYIESDSVTGKHKIAFVDESRNADTHAILYIAEIDNTATSLDFAQTNSYDLGNMASGDGIEGVSYGGKDSSGNLIFYVVRQNPKEVRKVVVIPGTTTIVSNTPLFDSTVYLSDVSWLRDLYYDNNTNSLFILGVGVSDAVPRKVINVKLDGTRIYAIDNINVGSPIKPEGIVFDLNGEHMYVVGEPHHLSRWQRQKDKFSSSYWFMGLGVGTYYYDAVAVDAVGNIGGATSKRRITLTGSGLNLPEIAYNSTTPFGGSFVNVNKIPVGLFSHDLDGQHYSLLDFDNSLVGWWRLNSANVNQIDESSYGRIGTVSGATFASAGKFGGAYSFDGIGDYIDLGSNIGLSVSGGTIGAWFKSTNDFNAQYIVSHRKDGFDINDRIYLRIGTGVQDDDFECGFADAISFTTDDNDVAGDNKWHYGLITWDSTTASCYLDGRFIGSYTATLPYADQTVYIGDLVTSIDDTFKWIGTIDEVLIFNRKLSEGEIKVLNASYSERYKINGLGSNLKGWWKFDDSPDDGVDDSSGSGNHGEKFGNLVLDSNAHEGSSYLFDGNGDYAEIKDNPSIRLSSGSVSAWINTNIFNGGRIVSKGSSINGAYLMSLTAGVDNDEIQVGFQGFNGINGRKTQTNILPSGAWTHIVFTFTNTELKVYVNGIDQGILVDSGVIDWNSGEDLRIGEGFVDYDGRIDDVMIFDKVLSAGEVANLYNSQISQYANTFNGLSEAGHSFTGYAVDLGGNKVTTEQRTVTVDITNPLISYGIGTLADNVFVGRNDIPVDVDVTESNFENMSHVLYQGKLDFDNLGGYWDFERDSLIQKDLSANNYDWTLVNKGGINLLNNPDFNLIERNYNPGWDVNLNGKIMPVQGANDWSSGYNDSVVNPAIGYHAHVKEGCDKDGSSCLEFVDMNGGIAGAGAHRWLGMKQSLGVASYENNEFAAGLKLTVSMDVKGNVIDKMIVFGLNYKNNIGGTSWATPDNCVSGNCVVDVNGRFGIYKTSNTWQRISHTFTLPSDIDLSGEVVLQIIGSYDTIFEGNLWVDNVQVEKGDIAHNFLKGPIVEGEIFEGALGMGGSGDYFSTNPGANSKLDIGAGDFSVSFLFKPNVFGGAVEHLIRKGALSTEDGWRIVHDKSANDIKVYVNNLGAKTFSGNPFFASISPLINTNNWYHVVLVLNRSVNGGAFFYIDGALSSASSISSWSSENIQSADSFYIGGNGNVNINTDGMIDEVMVFNKALSFDDVQDLHFPNRKIMGKEVINQILDKTWSAGIVDGFYQYYADVLDKAGNVATSELRRITLDNVNPDVNFIIPNTTYVFDEAENVNIVGGVDTNDEGLYGEMSGNGGAVADAGGAVVYKFMSLNMNDVHLMFRGEYIGTLGGESVKVDQDGVFPGGEIPCSYIGTMSAVFGWYDCGAINMLGWTDVYVKFTDGASGDWVIDTFVQTHSDMFPSNIVGADFTYQSYYPLGFGTIDVNLSSDDMIRHYSFVDFDRSLVGWWRLNVDNPSQVDDSSYGHVGTVSGAIFDSAGKFGGAYSFDNVDDVIVINDGNDLDFETATEDFSVFAWIKPLNPLDGDVIIQKMDAFFPIGDGWRFVMITGGTVRAYINDISRESTVSVSDGKWHHVGFVADRDGNLQVYVDSVASGGGVSIVGQTMDIAVQSAAIGASSYLPRETFFDGKIDEVLIFNRTLSDDEIKMLYDATENRYFETFSGLVNGHYGLKGYAVDLVGHKNETNRTVTINSDYPYIIPFDLGNQNINPGQTKVLSFEVTAHDGNGWGNLGTMEVSLVRGSINRAGSCVKDRMGGNTLEAIYICNGMDINYYDNAGEWNVRLRVSDAEGHMSNYFSDAFLLMEEAYINNPSSLDFGALTFESVNVWRSFLLRNWGNVPFSDISVEANDLLRGGTGTDKIDANRFYSDIALGAGACTGVNMGAGLDKLITGATLPVKVPPSEPGEEELYFCLSSIQTGLPGGNYIATGLNMWRITGTSSPVESCGNNIIDSLREEVCDCGVDLLCGTADDNVGAETCVSQGWTSGTLKCGLGCKEFDTSGCV